MRAVVLTAYGDVDRLELREVPDPRPADGEIKIRMVGASVNPVDWKQRSGALKTYMPLDLPAILGRDAAGEVVELGPGVTRYRVGARVMGRVGRTYAEQVVGPLDAWAEVPAGMDLADAGALPLVLLTGAQLIEEAVNPRPGDKLLVTGALGSVGRIAVHVAKARGAQVYAGVRAHQRAEAEKLGVAGVVALDGPAGSALPELDALADTIGGEVTQKLLPAIKTGGTIGSVVGPPAGAQERGLTVHAFLAHSDPKRLKELAQEVADGALVVPIVKRFPLAEAGAAQAFAEKGAGGKVLLLG